MFKYNNTHIFTGYLKQFLSSFNLPACKVYTHEFAKYFERYGREDPRVLESFDSINENRLAVRINYLKNNEISHYFLDSPSKNAGKASWRRSSEVYYDSYKTAQGLTRNLHSPGINYDTKTHEYLGDYLRFLRDYHSVNLMPLYNCFTDKIYNNINFPFSINTAVQVTFDSQDTEYRIYAIPVKLFAEYTIAIDSCHGVELFCGLYNTSLDMSKKAEYLAKKTYQKVNKAIFKQPFLYTKLSLKNWPAEDDFNETTIRSDVFTRWDIVNREKDLKLFIKVPVSCRSTITILEGDFRHFNNTKYSPVKYKSDGTVFNPAVDDQNEQTKTVLSYQRNHSVMNFNTSDKVDLNEYQFKPICQLQLLAFNTGESYPFSDRLVEYLSGSAITPIDEISDNIKRVQRVMRQNNNYFKIEGIWENKMQNILYDYMINSGPIVVDTNGELKDMHRGYHTRRGHVSKSTQFDILGYVDKDTEKLYASWKKENGDAKVGSSLQSVDIYDGLYNI